MEEDKPNLLSYKNTQSKTRSQCVQVCYITFDSETIGDILASMLNNTANIKAIWISTPI